MDTKAHKRMQKRRNVFRECIGQPVYSADVSNVLFDDWRDEIKQIMSELGVGRAELQILLEQKRGYSVALGTINNTLSGSYRNRTALEHIHSVVMGVFNGTITQAELIEARVAVSQKRRKRRGQGK